MCLLLSARKKAVFHFISHTLSLCHQLVYILIQQLDAVQNSGLTLMEGWFLCIFVRYQAFYHFFSFPSSTDHLLCDFALSLILSVQTCLLYLVSQVHSQLKPPDILLERLMS